MDINEAMAVLGITQGRLSPRRIRDRYIAELRLHHPDTNSDPAAGRHAANITVAYQVLLRAHEAGLTAAPPRPGSTATHSPTASRRAARRPSTSPASPEPTVSTLSDDTIELVLPADMALQHILERAHLLGEVIYLERSSGLVQLLMRFIDQPLCQVILDFQGRAARGTTEVFLSVASMDDRPPPPIEAITEFIVSQLRVASSSLDDEVVTQ